MAGGRGPQGRRHMTVSQAMKAAGSGNLNRVIRMIFGMYGGTLLAVVFFIAVAAVADVRGTLFLRGLIDDYIIPMTKTASPDFGPLFRALRSMALIYLVGAFAGFAYNRLMVQVGQGTMRRIREELFAHMEKLPISYFDTHAHGDIMSIYTNDTDTLRQFIGQSFPQLINSVCSIASVFISMCILNIPLTLISVSMTFGILFASGKIAAQSGRFFGLQQRHLGEVNGYIEEMMSGQKVIKVFSHEEKSIGEFRKKNEELRTASDKANTMANILMDASITPDDVEVESVRSVTAEKLADAKQRGMCIKYICRAEQTEDGVKVSVKPEELPREHAYNSVNGTSAVFTLYTDLAGELTIIQTDPGLLQTAYGIYSDLITLLKRI